MEAYQSPGQSNSGEKSSIEQIRRRFDNDVERFSNLETGQSAALDAALVLDLVGRAVARTNPDAARLLDLGCGAGNFSLRVLQALPDLEVTLVDLSEPMLARARQRVSEQTTGKVTAWQADLRDQPWSDESFDVILAAAVLHHLRDEQQWRAVFSGLYQALRPGGTLWVFDLVESDWSEINQEMWEQYADYLRSFRDEPYRQAVFEYIAQEDTPRSLTFQFEQLRQAGFERFEILHKHACFAAYVAGRTA